MRCLAFDFFEKKKKKKKEKFFTRSFDKLGINRVKRALCFFFSFLSIKRIIGLIIDVRYTRSGNSGKIMELKISK